LVPFVIIIESSQLKKFAVTFIRDSFNKIMHCEFDC
jgi:hypothetical protein